MTAKDFRLIAAVIDDLPLLDEASRAYVAEKFADALAEDNERFNRATFLRACGTERYTD